MIIERKDAAKNKAAEEAKNKAAEDTKEPINYNVFDCENLTIIAKRYDVSVQVKLRAY